MLFTRRVITYPPDGRVRRVLRLASWMLCLSVLALLAPLLPVIDKQLDELESQYIDRHAHQATDKYLTGLTPCGHPDDAEFGLWLNHYLPAAPSLAMDISHPFLNSGSIRLVGQDVFYLEYGFPIYQQSPNGFIFKPQGIPTIYHSRIPASLAAALLQVTSNEIVHAQAKLGEGLDGELDTFIAPMQRCGKVWGPPGTSGRAGKMAEIAHELRTLAITKDAGAHAAIEQSVATLAAALQAE